MKCDDCGKDISSNDEGFFWGGKLLCWTCVNASIKKMEQELVEVEHGEMQPSGVGL